MRTPDEVAAMLAFKRLRWGVKRIVGEFDACPKTATSLPARRGLDGPRVGGPAAGVGRQGGAVARGAQRRRGAAGVGRRPGLMLSLRTVERPARHCVRSCWPRRGRRAVVVALASCR